MNKDIQKVIDCHVVVRLRPVPSGAGLRSPLLAMTNVKLTYSRQKHLPNGVVLV